MIDPKLKQADLICGTASDFWSGKVASFISITCYHVNLKTDTLRTSRNACKIFSADFLAPWKCLFLSGVINTYTTHGHSSSSERLLLIGVSAQSCAPTKFIKISKIADDTYLGRVSSSTMYCKQKCVEHITFFPTRAATIRS